MSKNDDRIIKLQEAIDKERESIKVKEKERKRHITNNVIKMNNTNINILILNVNELKTILIQLYSLKLSIEAISKDYSDLDIYSCDMEGFAVTDWIEDVVDQITIVSLKERKTKLIKMESKLKTMLSDDKKTSLFLDDIEDFLK